MCDGLRAVDENLSYFSIEDQFKASNFQGCLDGVEWSDPSVIASILDKAATFASVPVSGFQVAAVARGESGRGYIGANMEFTGVPLSTSLHAEQAAVINAWLHAETEIEAIYISEIPCGYCLQFLQELGHASDLKVFIGTEEHTLSELFPNPFILTPGESEGLLHTEESDVEDTRHTDDCLSQRAVNAARRSYTPYTGSSEGFVIETMSGKVYAGRSIESGAFNPSIPPSVAALSQMNLSADREGQISRCVHAKLATAITHTYGLSKELIRNISSAEVECRQLEEN